jgi:cell division GTPase FtsZ
VKEHDVVDEFDYDVAFNFAFIGVGQGGGRIAETFWKLGYGRVGVINTAIGDLQELDDELPKLDLGTGGAGKDIQRGLAAIVGREEDVYEHLTRCVGKRPDYILICAGLGGGTGSGAAATVVEVARTYMEDLERPCRVGLVLTLPTPDEGHTVCRNAVHAFKQLHGMGCSPLIVIDNKRIGELYLRGVTQFYATCNAQVANLFHLFNQLASQRSSVATFDSADYATLLDAGIVTFGASTIEEYNSSADISEAIRKQMSDVVLAEVDLRTGSKAGCIFLGGKNVLAAVPMEFFGGGFDMLNRLLAENSVVHRGIYQGNVDDLRCYTMIAGLAPPAARLRQLASKANMPTDSLAAYLGVDDGGS